MSHQVEENKLLRVQFSPIFHNTGDNACTNLAQVGGTLIGRTQRTLNIDEDKRILGVVKGEMCESITCLTHEIIVAASLLCPGELPLFNNTKKWIHKPSTATIWTR